MRYKHGLFSIVFLTSLAACGLKRNLELPGGKNKEQNTQQTGQITSTPASIPAPTAAPTAAPAPIAPIPIPTSPPQN